ncbi:L-seryl-tRNA selenium transferase [Dehalogenimonas lykanthroporepellens BL-DC-9]|nr:L-seryl-tRNA selenium transferase [Dehalogenimonas lykanthroporepellens BL-DC-9]
MAEDIHNQLRRLPAVEKVLEAPELAEPIARYSRPVVADAVRTVIERLRAQAVTGGRTPELPDVVDMVREQLSAEWAGLLQPVINATGIILHTNLGRAPLADTAVSALSGMLGGYHALELDLDTGERGVRARETEKLLRLLTGAERALVVNNNAAAVLLTLAGLARGREVIVSRSELVQIGGGFRVPEVMAESGALMREVGTTNQTFIRDYEAAISDGTAMLLSVHRSNFTLRGFTHDPSLAELRELAGKFNLPLVYDLGSGAITDTAAYGMTHEPTVGEALEAGVDLVCVSGDKLMGGPQCGIILGRRELVDRLRKHPLLRALRIDKYAAVALSATLLEYLKGRAGQLPVYRMMGTSIDDLTARSRAIAAVLNDAGLEAEIVDGESLAGGGSLPEETLPAKMVAVTIGGRLDDFCRRLRLGAPPVLGRALEGRFVIDPRTVLPGQDSALLQAVVKASESRR